MGSEMCIRDSIDVVIEGQSGALDNDLGAAVQRALMLDRNIVRKSAEAFSWDACATQFLDHVASANHWST